MAISGSGQISISSSIHAASTQISFETSQSGKAFNYSLTRLSIGDSNSKSDLLSGYTGIITHREALQLIATATNSV